GVQKGFAQQFGIGGVAQVVDLATGPLIGQDLQDLEGDGDGDLFDLFVLLAVFSVGADVIAVPLSHESALDLSFIAGNCTPLVGTVNHAHFGRLNILTPKSVSG